MNRTYTFRITRAPWNTRNTFQVVAHWVEDWHGVATPQARVPNGCDNLSLREARNIVASLEERQARQAAALPLAA